MNARSQSVSEDGQIISGDEEKAFNTNVKSKKDRTVNKSTRLPGGSSSRIPHTDSRDNGNKRSTSRSRSPYRVPRLKSRSPYRASKPRQLSPYRPPRARSRSPYRAPKNTQGEKRRHDNDHYSSKTGSDPRRFKVHYEDKSFQRDFSNQSHGRHMNGGNGRDSNDRNRSRSPFRHGKDNRAYEYRGRRTSLANSATSDASEFERHQNPARNDDAGPAAGSYRTKSNRIVSPPLKQSLANDEQSAHESSPTIDEPTQAFSEAELIEQRRKRREAIKAKHKAQAPLLVQALESKVTSTPDTPLIDSSENFTEGQSPSTSIGSPRTERQDSPPVSPAAFAVDNDEELVNPHQVNDIVNDEQPSAADYDPNMDAEEDRPDHKKQDFRPNSETLDAVVEADHTSKPSKEFDMFADDEDDMFAPSDQPSKLANTTKEAKALDQSLLDNWDYPDGHYRIIIGELLDGRYAVQQQIGKGTFATVVRAQDTKTGGVVAVKIACNNETMYKAGTKEMDFLNLLNASDPEDKRHIIRMLRNFDHKGHMCLVFENLSADLREVLKKFGRNVGLNLKAIRSYAQQMFLALAHLKKNEILHADLKPDNILVSEKRNLLKICDLGTAAKASDAEITPYLVSRFYRAPEVILGMPFDYAIDMWSIGCTLFELYTGRILFAGADNNQMLRVIQECRSKFPIRMLKKSTLADKHFDTEANFVSIERDKITGKTAMRQLNFAKPLPGKDVRSKLMANSKGLSPADLKELQAFADLMEKCLQLDPARRITPSDALRHQFIAHSNPVEKVEKKKVKVPAMAPLRAR